MTNTVQITRFPSDFRNVEDLFVIGARDEGGCEVVETYSLPCGYTLGETILGDAAIFDPAGTHCEITQDRSGFPQLASGQPVMPVLRPSREVA